VVFQVPAIDVTVYWPVVIEDRKIQKVSGKKILSPLPDPTVAPEITPQKTSKVSKGDIVAHSKYPAFIESTKGIAIVTAYSCSGLTTDAEIDMNCPSLRNYPEGRTTTGTTPIPYKTVACDKANLGRTFHLEGVGEVLCTDTGGSIIGSGRFDLYLPTVQEARKFGKREIAYNLVK